MNWYKTALNQTIEKLSNTTERTKDSLPHVSIDGVYSDESKNPSWWTNGFYAGLLWMLYKDTNNSKYKDLAIKVEHKLDPVLNGFYGVDHDAGFQWHLSSVARYKILNEEDARRKGFIAASHLAGRFNPNGNYLRAWNWHGDKTNDPLTGFSIIDSMMNIPLLYWATEETNDPRYKNTAMKVADMVLDTFIRDNGSVHHIMNFNPHTGEFIDAHGGQGYSPDSTWTRGNAWCIYGMALSYKYTKKKEYLNAFKKVAKHFIEELGTDTVPVWDFESPKNTHHIKDSSAGAIAACGMLEVANFDDEESEFFRQHGERILRNLYENHTSFGNEQEEAVLLMGTVNCPAKKHINTPIIYGDFFFYEGIRKLNNKYDILW